MKRVLLGMSIVLSMQMFNVFAEQTVERVEQGNIEHVVSSLDSLFDSSESDGLNLTRSRRESILPRIGRTLESSSGALMFPDGTVQKRDFALTVLNKDEDLARFRIVIAGVGGLSPIIQEFVVGEVGDNYFGRGIEGEGTSSILLKRVKNNLELDYRFNLSGSRVEARVKLPR